MVNHTTDDAEENVQLTSSANAKMIWIDHDNPFPQNVRNSSQQVNFSFILNSRDNDQHSSWPEPDQDKN